MLSHGPLQAELPCEKQVGIRQCLWFGVSVPVASGLGSPQRTLGWYVPQSLSHMPQAAAWSHGSALGPGLKPEAGLSTSPMTYHCVQSCCELLQWKWPRTLQEGCPELISSVLIEGRVILRDYGFQAVLLSSLNPVQAPGTWATPVRGLLEWPYCPDALITHWKCIHRCLVLTRHQGLGQGARGRATKSLLPL